MSSSKGLSKAPSGEGAFDKELAINIEYQKHLPRKRPLVNQYELKLVFLYKFIVFRYYYDSLN
jgi:hypothetical protein